VALGHWWGGCDWASRGPLLASTSKSLAQMSKSLDVGEATKKCSALRDSQKSSAMCHSGRWAVISRNLAQYTLVTLFVGWIVWPSLAYPAEIKCATVWPLDAERRDTHTQQDIEQAYLRRWPSGRRPILGRSCTTGVLIGTVVQGDDEKFARFYRDNHPFLERFLLISPGGNVAAALNIGRLFRKYLIEALAPFEEHDTRGNSIRMRPWGTNGQTVDWCSGQQQCTCASACALIWFGAVEREGQVGLHRPMTNDPAFKALPSAEASTAYRRILGIVTAYLEEMEVPTPMIDAMVSTGSSEIEWVDSETTGLRRPASIAEWEDASCGSFTSEERSAWSALAVKKNKSSQEQRFEKMLFEKLIKDGSCRSALLNSQRDRLAFP